MIFLIKYTAYSSIDAVIGRGTTRVKNCCHGAEAQVKLEKHLRKKIAAFSYMKVIECKEEKPKMDFDDIFKGFDFNGTDSFNDLLKKYKK